MKTFYTLKESAKLFEFGYSYYTSGAKLDILENKEIADAINENYLTALFVKIKELLSPKQE